MKTKNAFTLAEVFSTTCVGNRRDAFTLAEVLITLGIIGVVAAMTMPTLMNSTQGAQYKTAFKKALSALSQAVTLNMALDDWNFADISKGNGVAEADQTLYKILSTRMNVVKTETTEPAIYAAVKNGANADEDVTTVSANTFVYFNDGIMFAYNNNQESCTSLTPCFGFVDVNGEKGPNKVTTCDTGKYSGTGDDTKAYAPGLIPAAVAADETEGETTAPTEGTKTSYGTVSEASCSAVTNPTDIYPVVFYDQTVMPNSAAGKAVLYGK